MRSKSVRSPGTTTARRPAASTFVATSRSWSSVRAASTMSAPASASATAVAAPMPRPLRGDDGDMVGDEEAVEDHRAAM